LALHLNFEHMECPHLPIPTSPVVDLPRVSQKSNKKSHTVRVIKMS